MWFEGRKNAVLLLTLLPMTNLLRRRLNRLSSNTGSISVIQRITLQGRLLKYAVKLQAILHDMGVRDKLRLGWLSRPYETE